MWLVWDTVRELAAEDGVELAESELIGLAPLAALLGVADRAGAGADRPGRSAARGGRRIPAGCATSRRCRRSSSASRRPGRRHGDGWPVPDHRGRSRRRAVPRAPDPRRGRDRHDGGRAARRPSQGDVARLVRAGSARASRGADDPVVAVWEGRIAAVGPRAAVETTLEAEGLNLGRFARLDAAGGAVTPGLVDPHTHLLFGGTREGELLPPPTGSGLPRDPRGRRRDPVDRRGDAGVERRGARRPRPALARRDARARRDDDRGQVGLRPRPRRPSCAWSSSRTGSGSRARSRSCRRTSAPTRSRSSIALARPAPRHMSARSSMSDCPGIAAHGRARFCDVFCEEGVFSADQSRRILEAAARVRDGAAVARRRARAVRRRGACRGAGCRLGRPPRGAVARPAVDALAEAARGDQPVVATLLPATTWFLMSDHYAPARKLIKRGVPIALATDFNPGTSPNASPPLVITVACLALGLTPDEALSAVTIDAAPRSGSTRRSGRSRRQAGRPRHLARADHDPDPVLAGRVVGRDRDQARARRPRPYLSAGSGLRVSPCRRAIGHR